MVFQTLTTFIALMPLVLGVFVFFWVCFTRMLAAREDRIEALTQRVAQLESLFFDSGPNEADRVVSKSLAPMNRRHDRPKSNIPLSPTLISVPDLAAREGDAGPSSETVAEMSRRFSRIWDLDASGASMDAIARETGQPSGEIELILGLKHKLATSSVDGARHL